MADAFAEITPTPYTADTFPWAQPDAVHADDLDSYQPSGDPYAGIPEFLNGRFETHADAPDASVPAALSPNDPYYHTPLTEVFPHKDSDG